MRRNSKQERERELADQARLTRAWRAWHFEQLEEALVGLQSNRRSHPGTADGLAAWCPGRKDLRPIPSGTPADSRRQQEPQAGNRRILPYHSFRL